VTTLFSVEGTEIVKMSVAAERMLLSLRQIGIFQASTGLSFTYIIGGDLLGLNISDPWHSLNHLSAPGCLSTVTFGSGDEYIKLNCFGLPMASASIAAQCTASGQTASNLRIPGTCSDLLSKAGCSVLDLASRIFPCLRTPTSGFRGGELFKAFDRADFTAPVDYGTIFDQSETPVPATDMQV
jgi:hypothetical protein